MRMIFVVCAAMLLGASVSTQASSPPVPKAQQTTSVPVSKAQQAAAAPAHGPPFPQHPCQQDTEQLCKAVQSGGGRKYYCLEKHKSQLHPACRRFLAAVDQSYAEWAAQKHETVAKMLADFYAEHEDKSRAHIHIRVQGPGTENMPAPPSPGPNKPVQSAPNPKKPVPASPTGNHESK